MEVGCAVLVEGCSRPVIIDTDTHLEIHRSIIIIIILNNIL